MGEPNNVLRAYMKKPERIRSILEYYIGRKLPQGWVVEEIGGFTPSKIGKGKYLSVKGIS